MRFTWLTYRIAIRRSFAKEYELFSSRDLGSTRAWLKQLRQTSALKARKVKERG